ncbi:bifunctional histidinol-phosphatase/imidazoleglycerol-phosphate dehydratase HisB [Blattabacterium cuenoti]|uniref:bifunctional histidinol-phosphatase/imidazoleglycerol-phosphate dehydratase HisB n=1 Tax=Blattabacterium cuenoti TaxID=1653831 RepID=UPI00163C7118|nr:bifunctional histidinol-phosphatase/imidazoleglycerol-phosphate dehydratase HisB [Blattabacterium cuenoti]
MKKILFIDRDGTIIKEVPPTYQIDTIEKVNFYPNVIYFLKKIVKELNYILVMVTNQDGLGTDKFPEKKFWPIHNHILKVLKTEGIHFFAVHIDKTYPEENSSTRKPGIEMLKNYFHYDYNLKKSFVIGDRFTDILLSKNLGCKAIWINDPLIYCHKLFEKKLSLDKDILNKIVALKTDNWETIYKFLKKKNHIKYRRTTLETDIKISIQLDGEGKSNIKTGLGFLDHLLEQMAFHSLINMNIYAKGDLHVDEHHTIEDTGISLGTIIHNSIKDKRGIERYGFFSIPMDDCLSTVVLDLGGRSFLSWKVKFFREKIGNVPTDMFFHFFKSFSDHAQCNLYIHSIGKNDHHKIESIFKAFARALRMSIQKNKTNKLPSSKGLLL